MVSNRISSNRMVSVTETQHRRQVEMPLIIRNSFRKLMMLKPQYAQISSLPTALIPSLHLTFAREAIHPTHSPPAPVATPSGEGCLPVELYMLPLPIHPTKQQQEARGVVPCFCREWLEQELEVEGRSFPVLVLGRVVRLPRKR